MMAGRPYQSERDLAAVTRIWREAGWIDDSEARASALGEILDGGRTVVADLNGSAECVVQTVPGSMRYGVGPSALDLDLAVITFVAAGHVARHQGLAGGLVARSLAEAADDGAAMASLGIFDQGYYDRFGFGTGAEDHVVSFDPATLDVAVPNRPPVRIGVEDHREIYDLLLRRHRGHGSVMVELPALVPEALAELERPVGLGFRSDDGRLTHCLLGSMAGHHGPLTVEWLIYEEPHQLRDLLGLLRALGDQVRSVTISREPSGVQLQALLAEPMRQLSQANFGASARPLHTAWSKVQWRLLDLASCIEACALPGINLTFGLRLHDPLVERSGATWPGIGGDYTVHLGEESGVTDGLPTGSAPVLDASVGAFTRLWLGVRPATGLTITDQLAGPPEILTALDVAFRLPPPLSDWPY